MKKIIKIDGMGCERCIKSVEGALKSIDNLKVLSVKIGEAEVEFEEGLNEKLTEKIIEKLDDVGFDTI